MKKVLLALIVVGSAALLYYFIFKPSEFEVNFKAKTLPGDLIETIRIWNRTLDKAKIVEVDSFNSLSQNIQWNERDYIYEWRFLPQDDSTTKVNIRISEPGRKFLNKLLVPFSEQAIEKDAYQIGNTFYEIVNEHLKITKVKVIGEVELNPSFCVCMSVESNQTDKANEMMKNFSTITDFITVHNLETDGPPQVRISKWDHEKGLLKFDFCFPIENRDSLPLMQSITYRKFRNEKALKAEYRGNYITSDRAWYALVKYAQLNNYNVNNTPIEYFHDNPTLGINEVSWKAEVYLPIIK
jgi:effector-binding domain-containing protein